MNTDEQPANTQADPVTAVPYDPTIYRGTAAYYTRGRPAYSRELVPTLAAEARLDGSGRLLDAGCGPGVLTLALAALVADAIGLDPDAEMLAEGARRAAETGIGNIRWVQARAEDLAALGLGLLKLVTFGQSFQWTDRERVADTVYELLEPGGTLALIAHEHAGRPHPAGPGYPLIPHDAIHALIDRYLGSRRRAGQGFATPPRDRAEDALARTRFGAPRRIYCPGRTDLVRDADGVLAGLFSMSFCAPHLFGDRRAHFEADVRAELARHAPDGLFWDWPGDTVLLLARKPG